MLASMGPTSFNVGDSVFKLGQGHWQKLQWGRRLSTSETKAIDAATMHTTIASMGPTSFNVGDSTVWRRVGSEVSRFNGADVFQRRRLRV